MKIFGLLLMLSLIFAVSACDESGSGGSSDADADGDSDGDADTELDTEPLYDTDDHDNEIGEPCRIREDCKTNYCESFWTAPADPNATCQEALPLGQMRITGNTRDFETQEIMPGVVVDVLGGTEVLQDPLGPALASTTSDENGLFEMNVDDKVTRVDVGVGARIMEDGYYPTAVGIVETEIDGMFFPPGVRNHDIWAVPETMVAEWTALLEKEDGLAFYLPLGKKGGAFGRIRDADNGQSPESPVKLVSRLPASEAQGIVRYLNDAGDAFVENKSGASGLFIILNASLGEKFDAYRDGKKVSIHECTVGNGADGVGVTTIQVDEDEW